MIEIILHSLFDADDLLEEFAKASLKRITADTEWEEYWFDLKDEIMRRMEK